MPFVTPKGNTSAANSNAAGRTTFRPPWVKDDGPASAPKTNTKPPWTKGKTDTTTAASKENGEKPTTTSAAAAKKTTTASPAVAAAASKSTTDSPAKKTVTTTNSAAAKKTAAAAEPAKKVAEPVKKPILKKAPEPVKKTTTAPATTAASKTPAKTSAAAKKKPPTPPSSSSEEEETEEEETEEESEEEESEEEESEEESEEEESEEEDDDDDDEDYTINLKQDPNKPIDLKLAAIALKPTPTTKKPAEAAESESELKRRFSLEKPKLRPVMVKRDKSMKKVEDNEDEEAQEDETEEERERRLRFKLEKPKLRHVKREEKPLPCKSTDNVLNKIRPVLKKVPKVDEILKEPKEEPKPEFKTKTLRKAPSIKREPSIKNVPAPPPLPSLVPKAPPPPPPPLGAPGPQKELTPQQKAALEKLKTRPRRRPDWSEMMKEVESGRKLRHVECNDRSQPILTCKSMTKVDDKFIYETEKGNSHNKLLKQIQFGVKLKPTQTNDRSRPILDGLRKFRRQMTIEEQLQKSQSKVNMLGDAPDGAAPAKGAGGSSVTAAGSAKRPSIISAISIDELSADELDDIDKLRDDLQSTKQMLALELRNREAQERENKKLLATIKTLEAELEREKSREKNLEYGSNVIVATMDPTPSSEQLYVNSLKKEAEDARKVSKDLEQKYLSAGELLDQAKLEIDEQKRQIQMLERKLAQALQGGGSLDGSRRPSDAHTGRDSSPDFELELSESDPDEPEEKKQERREKRLVKEVKVLRSKLTKVKVKEEAAKKEKDALKQAMKKNHVILKEEQKKFKKLEKEVQKMAASMKLDDDDLDLDDDEDAENKAEGKDNEENAEEEEESEEESSESEESESEEEEEADKSESEAEDAPTADKKANLEPRLKTHESRLSAMKKCNVLLQANVDNLQDEISQVRSKAANLQSELDAVLADLGL